MVKVFQVFLTEFSVLQEQVTITPIITRNTESIVKKNPKSFRITVTSSYYINRDKITFQKTKHTLTSGYLIIGHRDIGIAVHRSGKVLGLPFYEPWFKTQS